MKGFINALLKDKELYNLFRNEFTFHSSAIEGSTVSQKDNAKVLANENATHKDLMKQTSNKYDDDELQENFNLGKLFDYMIETLHEKITERELTIWHNILKKDTIWSERNVNSYGKYKDIPNNVGQIITPQPHEVPELMTKLINRLNKMTNYSLLDVCSIHCEFETIHPFLDGNGRIGRMLMLKMCLLSDIYPFIIENNNTSEYYSCLKMYRQTKSSNFLVEYCRRLQIIFIQKFNKFLTDVHVVNVINWFKSHKQITRVDIEQIFQTKSSNAKKILLKLLKLNLIQKKGVGPSSYYVLA